MTKRIILFNGTHSVGDKEFIGGIELSVSSLDYQALKNAGVVYKTFDNDGQDEAPAVIEIESVEVLPVVEEDKEKTLEELRVEYKAKFGKNAFNGWDKETIINKLK